VPAEFYIRDTFEIPSRNLFVLAGSIVDGTVRPGMSVHIYLNKSFLIDYKIHALEFARRDGREDTCLCLRCADDDELDFLKCLNLGDETVTLE
jgi:hypothetical protein